MGMAITIMPSYSGKPGHITIMLLPAALLLGMRGGGGVTVRRGGGGAGTVYNRPPAIVTSLQNFPKNTKLWRHQGGEVGVGGTGAVTSQPRKHIYQEQSRTRELAWGDRGQYGNK